MATAASLPIIDISPFLPSTSGTPPAEHARDQTLAALRHALLEYGFFYLTNHGVSRAELDTVLAHAREFFTTATADEKRHLKRRDPGIGLGDGSRGYQIMGENVTKGKQDWHEGLDWYRPSGAHGEGLVADDLEDDEAGGVRHKAPTQANGSANGNSSTQNGNPQSHNTVSPPYSLLMGPNLWPSTPPTFRDTYVAHVKRMRILGLTVLRAMGAALDLADPDVFAAAAADSFWVMRAIGYPPLSAEAAAGGGVSCGEHSDYGCLTLLLADSTKGALQVRDPQGEWMDVDPIDGAFVVNVGDMVELWTAGLVKSTKHRVVHRGQGYRVSVPFFLEPGRDVVVEPLNDCVQRMRQAGKRPLEGKVKYWDHLVSKVGGNFYKGDGS